MRYRTLGCRMMERSCSSVGLNEGCRTAYRAPVKKSERDSGGRGLLPALVAMTRGDSRDAVVRGRFSPDYPKGRRNPLRLTARDTTATPLDWVDFKVPLALRACATIYLLTKAQGRNQLLRTPL